MQGFEKVAGTKEGAVKAMRYNEGALLFTLRAFNRALSAGSWPAHTAELINPALVAHGPRLIGRINGLLGRSPDSNEAYASAGFLQTLAKLLPVLEAGLCRATGLSSMAAEQGGEAPAPAPEPSEAGAAPEPEPAAEVDDDDESDDDDL